MKNTFHNRSEIYKTLVSFLATGALTAMYILFVYALYTKSQKNDEILQHHLDSVQKELQENKNLDIYARVRLHEEERLLIYFDSVSQDYRKLKRQILKEYKQKNK